MLFESLGRAISQRSEKALLGIILVLPFVLLAPIGYFLFRGRQNDVEKLATELRSEITDRIEDNIKSYLKTTHLVNQTNAVILEVGQFQLSASEPFSLDEVHRLEGLFAKQLQNFKEINNIYIGNPEGNFFGAEWQQRNDNEWAFILNESTADTLNPSQNWDNFDLSYSWKVFGNFEPRKRPWYQAAKHTCQPTWSEAYIDFSTRKPAVTSVYPICDRSGKLIAVLGSDFLFSEVDEFLRELKEERLEGGEIFIINRAGQLLTTSSLTKNAQLQLIKATDSEDRLTRETARYLESKINNSSQIARVQLDFRLNGHRQFVQVTPLSDNKGLDWLIVVVIPEDALLQETNTNIRNSIGLYFAVLILAMTVVILAFRWRLLRAENKYLQRLAQLKDDFFTAASRFVPYDFLQFLGKSIIDVELGDQIQKEMTIMFVDIRSFTNLSEKMTPQENFKFINSYFGRISPIIINHEGIIDKYIGDAIMALFPQSSADMALQAAIQIQHEVSNFNQYRQNQSDRAIAVGVGLHTGKLILGTIGEPKRMETTVISDAVNLASRLEGLTKLYGASILVSGETLFTLDPEEYSYRWLGRVKIKGRHEPVSVFEVYDGEPATIVKLKNQSKVFFESAVVYYSQREFAQAERIFRDILEINIDDRAAKMYAERCEHYQNHGVPTEWSGIEGFHAFD